jgi:WD40-like Beta Propeller Repeat
MPGCVVDGMAGIHPYTVEVYGGSRVKEISSVERCYCEQGERLWRAVLLFGNDREVASDSVEEAFAQAIRRGAEIRDIDRWVWRAAFRIYGIPPDGSGLRRLADGTDPAWSPDGTWLAFTRTYEATGPQIWVVDSNGGGGHAVTSMPGFLKGSGIFARTGSPSWGVQSRS